MIRQCIKRAAAPSPVKAGPCISADGARLQAPARRRKVGAGLAASGRHERPPDLPVAIAGPTMSPSVDAGVAPNCVKRSAAETACRWSPRRRGRRPSCAAHAGVSSQRTFLPPRSSVSPSFKARGSRVGHVAQPDVCSPTRPCAGVALGAAASHWLSAPGLRPDSTWLQVVQRNLSSGSTLRTASDTSGKSERWP